jgi:hypothetical protein
MQDALAGDLGEDSLTLFVQKKAMRMNPIYSRVQVHTYYVYGDPTPF